MKAPGVVGTEPHGIQKLDKEGSAGLILCISGVGTGMHGEVEQDWDQLREGEAVHKD